MSSQVSLNARIIPGSWVRSSSLPSLTSRLFRNGSRFEFLQPTVPSLTKPPSEYMKSGQMFYAFEMEEKMLPYVAEFVGADRLVFAIDYNHSDSKFPHTVEEVMERKDLSDALKTKIMGENAATLYNL